jgi:hypothetical protein
MRKLKLSGHVLILALALHFWPAISLQKQAPGASGAPGARSQGGVDEITPDLLKNYLYFIADDVMEGRDTPSRGLNTVANFIAMNLQRWGFKPAGDDPKKPFFQDITLSAREIDPAATRAEIASKDRPRRTFAYAKDFLAAESGTISGSLVFAGHGWVIKSKNLDPYKDIDVKDKIVIVCGNGFPKGVTFTDLRGGKPGVDWFTPAAYAAAHGAVSVIYVPDSRILAKWDENARSAIGHPRFSVEKSRDNTGPAMPTITPSAAMLDELFQNEKHSVAEILNSQSTGDDVDSFELDPDKKLSFTVGVKQIEESTQNVVAVWEGADPVLKNEYVALGAHYDHVGVGLPGSNGRGASTPGNATDIIYNGADDDGSGTTALLAMAETLAHNPRPKRSVLFVWHCGEEKGLWGSRYFTDNPTVPLRQITTQINIDMIGRSKSAGDTNPLNKYLSGPDAIYVIGSRMMSTELGDITAAVNQAYLNLGFDYRYDDPHDPNRFFYRSDHFNYAKHGIPIVFFFDGVHEDYHRPGDEPNKIDYEKMSKVTRTVYLLLLKLASIPARVKVDKPVPTQSAGD